MKQADDELLTDGLTLAELNERLDLLGPEVAGTFDSFEALVKHTDHLVAGSKVPLGGRQVPDAETKKPTG